MEIYTVLLGSSGFPTGLRHLQNEGSPQAKRKEKRGVRGGGSPPGSGRTRDGYGSHSSKNPPAKETLRVAQTARSHEQGRRGSHATSRGIEDAGYTPALLGAPPPIGLSVRPWNAVFWTSVFFIPR